MSYKLKSIKLGMVTIWFLTLKCSSVSDLRLSETAVTSADFNTVRALVSGELDTFLGFKFHTLGDRTEGGLSIDGSSIRSCLAFHKTAIGYGEGIGPKTEINYVPEKTSHLVNAMLSACSVAIDSEGIVEVQANES